MVNLCQPKWSHLNNDYRRVHTTTGFNAHRRSGSMNAHRMRIGVFTLRGTDPDSRTHNNSISREKHMIGTYTYVRGRMVVALLLALITWLGYLQLCSQHRAGRRRREIIRRRGYRTRMRRHNLARQRIRR